MTPQQIEGILHVEDDSIEAEAMERALTGVGLEHLLHRVDNGQDALAKLGVNGSSAAQTSWLIVLDLQLGDMFGLDLLEKIRAEPLLQSVPVFVMTTLSNPETLRRAHALHVTGYFLKNDSDYVRVAELLKSYCELNLLPPRKPESSALQASRHSRQDLSAD